MDRPEHERWPSSIRVSRIPNNSIQYILLTNWLFKLIKQFIYRKNQMKSTHFIWT